MNEDGSRASKTCVPKPELGNEDEMRFTSLQRAAPLFSLGVVIVWLFFVATSPREKRIGDGSSALSTHGTVGKEGHDLTDAEYAERLPGDWKRTYFGEQSLQVRRDGTATIVARPDTIWALLLGNRLEVRFQWEVMNGHVIYHVTGGSPNTGINIARSLWGDRWAQQIRLLDNKRLVLLWADGDIDEWHRATAPEK